MKVLILSGNTGGGHNSCAKAISERFLENGHTCNICDCLSFISPAISKIVSLGHTVAYRYTPFLFNIGYTYFENHSSTYASGSLIDALFVRGGKKLAKHINDNNYDLIICTHAFSVYLLNCAAPYLNRKIKSAFVATDFTCSPTAEKGDTDVYFIPHIYLADEFEMRGVDKDKLIACGIPVKKAFYDFCDKNTAKQKIGINPTNKHILVMCGSMGCGPIVGITAALAKEVDEGTEITIICGSNRSLKHRLKFRHKSNKNVHIIGFTDNIPYYMNSADLFITKPGGISLSEGTVKKLPMVLLPSVGGCETHNVNFFVSRGAALCGKNKADIIKYCTELLKNEDLRNQTIKNLTELEIDNAADTIFEILTK